MAQASRALLQARSALLDKEIERHDLEERCKDLTEANAALQDTARANSALAADCDRLKGELAQIDEQNADLGKQVLHQGRSITELTSVKAALEKRAANAEEENNNLRDELHRMTIENARLQGYNDRVKEFDPVTEAQEYRDLMDPRHGRLVSDRPFRDTGEAFRERMPAAAEYTRGGLYRRDDRAPSWYRRRA